MFNKASFAYVLVVVQLLSKVDDGQFNNVPAAGLQTDTGCSTKEA